MTQAPRSGRMIDGQPPARDPIGSRWSPLRIVAVVLAVVFSLLALGGVLVYNAIRNGIGGPAPAAVPAPIAWRSGNAVLSAPQPVAMGHFTVVTSAGTQSDLRVGLSVGVPRRLAAADVPSTGDVPRASIDPAAMLLTAAVRLTVTGSDGREISGCFAPCELSSLRSAFPFNCDSGTCRFEGLFKLELLAANAPASSTVSVDVSAAAATSLQQPFPQGVRVEMAIGEEAAGGG